MPTGKFPSISREEHFAQKLHAYTLQRGDRSNTRVKDLVDLVLLIDAGALDPERLFRDVRDTFQRRKTHDAPATLKPPPEFWRPVFAKLAGECGIDPDIEAQFERVRSYWEQLG
jgi:hypothetical protein